MAKFLFWNLNRMSLENEIAHLIAEHQIDVAIFAEADLNIANLLLRLNRPSSAAYVLDSYPTKSGIQFWLRYDPSFLAPVFDDVHLTVRSLKLPGAESVLLFAVHLPDKFNNDPSDQLSYATEFSRKIREIEGRFQTTRSIVVGDLNMNPYDQGMLHACGLNAVLQKSVWDREHRTVYGKQYPYFYNPMWKKFSHGESSPAGTYFNQSPRYESNYWNILDQVIFRPNLAGCFKEDSLEILDRCEVGPLVSGKRRIPAVSDHLPIKFQLIL